MKLLIIFLISTLVLIANEELSFENDFLQSLDEVSEIATQTKLNIDDTPSFVTILHQAKLQALGIDTVFEAIGLVPGVQLKREASGVPIVIFRGVSQKGEVKLMLDGVSINNTYRGSIYHYLDFPIELIDRIEVIRGSSSILYGSGAISGVINIITKTSSNSNSNQLFLSTASKSSHRAGAFFTKQIDDFHIAFDTYYYDNNKMIDSTDRHLNDYSVGVNINNGIFGLLARIKKSDQGNAYGILDVADTNLDKYNNVNDTLFLQLSYNNELTQTNKIEILTGINEYKQSLQVAHPSSTVDSIYTSYKERIQYAQVNLISTSLENHHLLIGARFESANIVQSEWKKDSVIITPTPKANLSRYIHSLYLLNNYAMSPSTDISAGFRYDKYSDFGSSLSPTFGVIYRANKKVKLKALYSHAYRAPSWVELTSNPNLKVETSKSFEAGIIYKHDSKNTLRTNFYSFRINDMIIKETLYVQNTYNKFHGAELEYIFTNTDDLEFNIFMSIIQNKDENRQNLVDIANKIASISLIYETSQGLKLGSYLKYVSSSSRSINDTRNEISSSVIFDQVFSYSFKNLSTNLTIKDLFDKGSYYALPQSKGLDFENAGRSFILKAIWEF